MLGGRLLQFCCDMCSCNVGWIFYVFADQSLLPQFLLLLTLLYDGHDCLSVYLAS